MLDEKSEPSSFRVVDRRPFSADGTRREARPEEPKERAETASRRTSTPPPKPAPRREERQAYGEPEPGAYGEAELSGFETLVSYLSTTAMFQMGLLPGPGGERIPADLSTAHRTIDLLEVLQEKTQGNLTPDEQRLLDEVLYELRMSYVEVEKRATAKRK